MRSAAAWRRRAFPPTDNYGKAVLRPAHAFLPVPLRQRRHDAGQPVRHGHAQGAADARADGPQHRAQPARGEGLRRRLRSAAGPGHGDHHPRGGPPAGLLPRGYCCARIQRVSARAHAEKKESTVVLRQPAGDGRGRQRDRRGGRAAHRRV